MNIWVVIILLAWAMAIALLDWQLRKSAKKLNEAIQGSEEHCYHPLPVIRRRRILGPHAVPRALRTSDDYAVGYRPCGVEVRPASSSSITGDKPARLLNRGTPNRGRPTTGSQANVRPHGTAGCCGVREVRQSQHSRRRPQSGSRRGAVPCLRSSEKRLCGAHRNSGFVRYENLRKLGLLFEKVEDHHR